MFGPDAESPSFSFLISVVLWLMWSYNDRHLQTRPRMLCGNRLGAEPVPGVTDVAGGWEWLYTYSFGMVSHCCTGLNTPGQKYQSAMLMKRYTVYIKSLWIDTQDFSRNAPKSTWTHRAAAVEWKLRMGERAWGADMAYGWFRMQAAWRSSSILYFPSFPRVFNFFFFHSTPYPFPSLHADQRQRAEESRVRRWSRKPEKQTICALYSMCIGIVDVFWL